MKIQCPMCEHIFDSDKATLKYDLWKIETELENMITNLIEFRKTISKELKNDG